MRNEVFLKKALKGKIVDHLYHLGLSSISPEVNLMKDIKAVIMSGSRDRVKRMAKTYITKNKITKIHKLKKDERFYGVYVDDVLFISHGMGMPSMSICLQEVLKLIYYAKKGKMKDIKNVFICRIGTSGGFNIPSGSLVLSSDSCLADLSPYYTRRLEGRIEYEKVSYNKNLIKDIIKANPDTKIEVGTTISCDDFYLEQLRSDGAIIHLKKDEKEKLFKTFVNLNVKNMEMEAAALAAICKDFGHNNFSTICCTLVDRYNLDQVTSTPKELKQFSINAENVIFNYLKTI